jgi:hypothetical protein
LEQCGKRSGSHGEQTARRFRRKSFAQLEVEAGVIDGGCETDARQSVDDKVDLSPLNARRQQRARARQCSRVVTPHLVCAKVLSMAKETKSGDVGAAARAVPEVA